MRKCKDLYLSPFGRVLRWVKEINPDQYHPIYIPKYGGRSKQPFRLWCFANCLLLMSNENAKNQVQYILTRKKWTAFIDYVKKTPEMPIGVLSQHFKDFECTNKVFWPSIISICKAYLENYK